MQKIKKEKMKRQPHKWLVVRFESDKFLGAMKYPEEGRPKDMRDIPNIRAYRLVFAYTKKQALKEGDEII